MAQHPLGDVSLVIERRWQAARSGNLAVGDGAYDIVVLDKASGVSLGIYRASAGKPGVSLVRVIHAAPELGSPELTLDSKPAVKSLSFTQSTPYLSVSPGVHTLGAMRVGDSTPLVSGGQVRLIPGEAYSAIVIGSRGQRVRLVKVVDRGAPLVRHSTSNSSAASGTKDRTRTVVVKPGESLWTIARSGFPAGASNAQIEAELIKIWNGNAKRIGTGDPNLIFPGQRLAV